MTNEYQPSSEGPKHEGIRRFINVEIVQTVVGVLSALVALGTLILANNTGISYVKPSEPSHPFNYLPYLIIFAGLFAVAIVAVGFSAAQAGIRKRERRRDAIEGLIDREKLSADDAFTKDAGSAYVAIIEQFARDVVDLSKTVSRREATDVVSARQIRRVA